MSETTRAPRHADTAVSSGAAPALSAPPGRCRLDIGYATSPGRERERNEDSFFTQHLAWCNRDRHHELALLVLADGMGGHEAGDEASGLAVRAVAAAMNPLVYNAAGGRFVNLPDSALLRWVVDALKEANQAVREQAAGQPAERAMAATVVVGLVWNDRVTLGHVGDCRAYHCRAGQLSQLTRDHTVVARLVERGRITRAQARHHPRASEVTRAVGAEAAVEPDTHQLTLAPGDWLLLACDGLYNPLDETGLPNALQEASSAGQLARQLVEQADREGGGDNCTAIAVRCG